MAIEHLVAANVVLERIVETMQQENGYIIVITYSDEFGLRSMEVDVETIVDNE